MANTRQPERTRTGRMNQMPGLCQQHDPIRRPSGTPGQHPLPGHRLVSPQLAGGQSTSATNAGPTLAHRAAPPAAATHLSWHAGIGAEARAILFTAARTPNTFSDTPVSDEELSRIWELARWAPTSFNIQPLRVTFVRTSESRARLAQHMYKMNREKTATAPATAILAADLEFHMQIPRTNPARLWLKEEFADKAVRHEAARFNATLQAGYFILAVRAGGLAAGPMLGYDPAGIDAEFFAGTALATVLVVNIGRPGENPWPGRLPRLDHDDVITWA
jgi:3-hydroxypropanoate dehydrogenase